MYDLPHFVEYAVYDVVTNLLEARNLEDKSVNRAAIENELRTKGYKIYTTVDREMQTEMQDTFATYDNYPKMRYSSDSSKTTGTNADGTPMVTIYPQVGAVVIDQSTGQIKAMVGSRTEPTAKKLRNRAYQNRVSIGSTIKPLAVYGPALDKGAGLGTIIARPDYGMDFGSRVSYNQSWQQLWSGHYPDRYKIVLKYCGGTYPGRFSRLGGFL